MLITRCSFVDSSFACIGIGSETSGGIRNARIEHCKFLGARSHAIYIKSRPGRGAFIEDISADDLDVSGMQAGFLRINMLDSGKHDEFDVPGDEGIPTIRNFRFSNVRVTDVPTLVNASAQFNDLFRGLVIHRIRKKKQGPVVAAGKRALNNETFW